MTKQKKLRHSEYYDLQPVFDRLYAESQQGKIFTKLMDIISSEENIRLAYRNIKRNGGSNTAGTDKQTIRDIEKLPVEQYVRIVQRKLMYYKPKPVKRVEIPKPNGKIRPLGIPTIVDRLVQQCILQVMEPICEAKFYERSNGFRPNRSAENAIAQCYKMINLQKLYFVVDVDIKGFFDNVNHTKLIQQIWHMGIRDKKLLCIIREMLKAPIVMPDGTVEHPIKGTPQGGILSPLLSNIVLNELDWWIASQWENMPTKYEYSCEVRPNGTINKTAIYGAFKNTTKLKEVHIVRYADDFKLFCRKRSDAEKVFIAVKLWLQDRLKLEISEEKSKIVNLKRHYSEFLGFEMKAVKKRKRYVVKSHMTEKAISKEKAALIEQVKQIAHVQDRDDEAREITLYNSMVFGIHNYYRYATMIATDCEQIHRAVSTVMKNRLYGRLTKKGQINEVYIRKNYGDSGYFIIDHYREAEQQAQMYDSLVQIVEDSKTEPAEPIPYSEDKTILPELTELYQQNNDLVGWICVEDTNINYPVMQTVENPNYYLKRGFDREYSSYGCPYVQEDCDVLKPSDNLVIYGHHMNNGSMFADLEKFKDEDFWQEHKTITFNTLTDRNDYEIFAVFKTVVYTDSPEAFKYYRFTDTQSAEEFAAYVEKCKELSLYDTDISAEYGDKLITLSTCEYSRTNGRLVVVAKKVTESSGANAPANDGAAEIPS